MLLARPYFMENSEWYYHDEKKWKHQLTAKGKKIPKVVKSYEEYYGILDSRFILTSDMSANEKKAIKKAITK